MERIAFFRIKLCALHLIYIYVSTIFEHHTHTHTQHGASHLWLLLLLLFLCVQLPQSMRFQYKYRFVGGVWEMHNLIHGHRFYNDFTTKSPWPHSSSVIAFEPCSLSLALFRSLTVSRASFSLFNNISEATTNHTQTYRLAPPLFQSACWQL